MTASAGSASRLPRNRPVEIAGTSVSPGTRRAIELPVTPLPTDTSLSMSVMVVNGLRPGPTMWLSGAIHGCFSLTSRFLRWTRPRV